jgi:nucleoside-diphosphate-sugar epimerase
MLSPCSAYRLTFDYHREHNLDVRVARIFNTYGPRMALDDGRVVSNFVSQVCFDTLLAEPFPLIVFNTLSST